MPDELKTIWAGTGGSGNASKASLKLDTSLELKTGQLKVHLLDGKHADNKCLSAQQTIILCEIYLKLLVVLFQHWIVLTSLWGKPKRSLVKGTQMLREQSARLAKCINHQDSFA